MEQLHGIIEATPAAIFLLCVLLSVVGGFAWLWGALTRRKEWWLPNGPAPGNEWRRNYPQRDQQKAPSVGHARSGWRK